MMQASSAVFAANEPFEVIVERSLPALGDIDFEHHLDRLPAGEAERLRGYVDRRGASESLQGLRLLQAFCRDWQHSSGVAGASIARDCRGKPYIAAGAGLAPAVNLSHGGGYVVLAAARDGEMGVDVEPCRTLRPALMAACIGPRERAWIAAAAHEHARRLRFARIWTLKESLMKATGEGLAIDPLDIEFSFSPAPRLVRSPCGLDWRFQWSCLDGTTQLAICHRPALGEPRRSQSVATFARRVGERSEIALAVKR